MDKKIKITECLSKKRGVYELQVENLKIEMNYSSNNKKMDECMLNILKQKNTMV